jgi:hypothetical protein
MKETNYQVAVEKTLVSDLLGNLDYNDEVLKPKFNKIKMDLVKHLLDLNYTQYKEYLEDYTEIGYDDFDNYDEFTCDFLRGVVVLFITEKIDDTEYTQEVMDEWDNEKYPD